MLNLVAHLDNLITITLSRRNLTGLLEQMDENRGTNEATQLMRRSNGALVIVVGEEDETHYAAEGRDGRAGASGPSQRHGEKVV